MLYLNFLGLLPEAYAPFDPIIDVENKKYIISNI